jgi:mono/diheme cytochrome c family protein
MRSSVRFRWLFGAGVLVPAVLTLAVGPTPRAALGADKKDGPAPAARQVSYLRRVRPILAQHCFQCHTRRPPPSWA